MTFPAGEVPCLHGTVPVSAGDPCPQGDAPLRAGGVRGIRDHVHDRLLHQALVHFGGYVADRAAFVHDPGPFEQLSGLLGDPLEERVDPYRSNAQLRRAHEVQALPDDELHPGDLLLDVLEGREDPLIPLVPRPQEAAVNADAGDGIADLVGKPRRHLAKEAKAFVQVPVLLLHLHVREVLEERADPRPALPFPQLRQGEPDGSRCVFYAREGNFEAGRKVLQIDRFEKNPEEVRSPLPCPVSFHRY